ncbi:MAG: C4-dicarboxylate TRAP transporter substrate-binding protein [Clostridiales Family XIII bacterium]|nr:C4-dicarboxylate TRAP transporter substrate-binding protein [Clostridiales Family XIII bacterium]
MIMNKLRNRRNAWLLAAFMLILIPLAGCSGSDEPTGEQNGQADDGQTYSLRIGNVLSDTDPITVGLRQMADTVRERTDGKLDITVYPSSQLGDTADVLEQAKSGTNVGIIIDSGILADYVPDMAIYSAPYVFDSIEDARKFIDTDIFKEWDDALATHGMRDLSFNWYQGARHFLTNKRVEKPQDLNGLRLRTMGSEVAQESMKAFGAIPTSMAWGEVYSGLQSKALDAAEGQITAVYGASLYEVIDYIAETGHFLLYTGLVVSEQWFQSLPEEYQQILLEESRSAGDYATELTLQTEVEQKAEMQTAGVEFVTVDIEPFKEASRSVYTTMGWEDLKASIDESIR